MGGVSLGQEGKLCGQDTVSHFHSICPIKLFPPTRFLDFLLFFLLRHERPVHGIDLSCPVASAGAERLKVSQSQRPYDSNALETQFSFM